LAKRYDDPIDVTPDPAQNGAPLSFLWRGRRYEVDQWLMSWREAGEWWLRHGSDSTDGDDHSQRSSRRSREQDGSSRRSREQDGSSRRSREQNGHREQEYFRVVARPSGSHATGDLDADGFMRHPGGVYDVYLDRVRGEWRLARIWD
jgi:hypothetical protein